MSIIKDLVRLANALDLKGLYKEADIVDGQIYKIADGAATAQPQNQSVLRWMAGNNNSASLNPEVKYVQEFLNRTRNANLQADGINGA